MNFKDFFKNFINSDDRISVAQSETIEYRDVFQDNQNVIVNNYTYINTANADLNYETKIEKELNEIQLLINNNQYDDAISQYYDVLSNPSIDINVLDRIEISIGLLNCYVNKFDYENAEKQISALKSNNDLGSSNSIWKYYYFCAVHHYNNSRIDKAIEFVRKTKEYNSQNIKVLLFEKLCLAESITSFEELTEEFITEDLTLIHDLHNDEESEFSYLILGQIALHKNQFSKAIDILSMCKKQLFIVRYSLAISSHMVAVTNSNTKFIDRGKIDYYKLRNAMNMYEELLKDIPPNTPEKIKTTIVNNYLHCLYLSDNLSEFRNKFLEYQSIVKEDKEIQKLHDYVNYTETGELSFNTGNLTLSESQWLTVVELHKGGKYGSVIEILSNDLLEKLNEDRFNGIKLNSLLMEGLESEFIDCLEYSKNKYPESLIIIVQEMKYYEKFYNYHKALNILESVSNYREDSIIMMELYELYLRNNDGEAINIGFEIVKNEKFLPSIKDWVFKSCMTNLIQNEEFQKARDMLEAGNGTIQNLELYNKMEVDVAYYSSDYPYATKLLDDLYTKTADKDYLYKSMVASFKMNDLDSALKKLEILIKIDKLNESHYLGIMSDLYLLSSDEEKSYQAIKSAVELDKDLPRAESHAQFAHRTIRLGRIDDTSYVHEYATKYPTHNEWLKTIKALKTSEDSTETLTDEMTEFLTDIKESFNNNLNNYKNRRLNYTSLCNLYGRTYVELLSWRYFYGIDVWVANGNKEELLLTEEPMLNQIVLDSASLYIFHEIGLLSRLNKIESIIISYSTIEELQLTYLKEENKNVPEILRFIKEAVNVVIEPKKTSIVKKQKDNFEQLVKADQVDSIDLMYSLNVPYVSSDIFINLLSKHLVPDEKAYTLVTFLRLLLIQELITEHEYISALINLKKGKYEFITFNEADLYAILEKNEFVVNEDLILFFNLKKSYGLTSCLRVYSGLLRRLYEEDRIDCFDEMLIIFIKLFDKYFKKRKHYLHLLAIKHPAIREQFYSLMKASNIYEIGVLMAKLHLKGYLPAIQRLPEYIRYDEIFNACMGSLLVVFRIIDRNKELDKYKSILLSNIENLSSSDIDRMIELVNQYQQ